MYVTGGCVGLVGGVGVNEELELSPVIISTRENESQTIWRLI